jgi:UDP-glucose:(heptosyl)LPS alpha-1,3-glucosyltransferase
VRLALLLYKYFPYGGLQRDFARIVAELQRRGHHCRVYCLAWQGDQLAGIDLRLVPVTALTNVGRNRRFLRWVQADLGADPVDGVVGFNRMPGLDVYFAADPCFVDKARQGRPWWYRLTPRYRHFAAWERAVFDPAADTEILLISATEQRKFEHYYHTPARRLHLLPPGVSRDRRAPPDAAAIRQQARESLGLVDSEYTLLMVGSGFITKGLDRAIAALARLQAQRPRQRMCLLVAGQDRERPFRLLARRKGVAQQVRFLGGRGDVPELLLAADLLVHPARSEAAGMVLLEALVAGLPVVVSGVCGYAGHIAAADAGIVLAEPFSEAGLDQALERALEPGFRERCRGNGLAYAAREDLYSMHSAAAGLIEQAVMRKTGKGDG